MITPRDRKLGERIQRLRKKAGLTQDQLAEKANISMKYMQFIESARRTPGLKTVYRISDALKVKVSEIFPF